MQRGKVGQSPYKNNFRMEIVLWLESFLHLVVFFIKTQFFEPRHEKTNNVFFEQVRHKLICTFTEGNLEILNLERNCTICVVKTKG